MDSEADISNAIAQLEMLGIERQKAIKALSRYNYNVERAADFVFSGNAESDDSDGEVSANHTNGPAPTNSNELEWPWAEPSTFDNITADLPQRPASQPTGTNTDSMNQEQLPVYMVKDYEKKHKQRLDTTGVTHDTSYWSLVPFTANEDTVAPATTTESKNMKSDLVLTQPSLTWWNDPEEPSARAAITDLPIGLRPPSYNFAYSPIIIQALFHVPLFRQAVLSYRPTPHAWGAPLNYWKGFGESVPGYKHKSNQQMRQSSLSSSSSSRIPDSLSISTPGQNQNKLSSSHNPVPSIMDLLTDNSDNLEEQAFDTADPFQLSQKNHHDPLEQEPIELISVTQETADTPLHKVDELVPLTKESLALAELQKLFAFLGNTKRRYGSVAHFMRATNARTVTSSTDWQVDDKSIEDFLDSVIGEIVVAENANNIDQEGDWKEVGSSSLKNMFFLQAQVENGSDTDIEEIYYLNLGINTAMHSFYDCLDPLVYETFPNEAIFDASDDDDEIGSNNSDDFNGMAAYKLTTFLQVPPLLLVTLEDRHDYQQQATKKDGSFKVEKTIYLDRYLIQNKALVLEKYQLADQWKQDIRRMKVEVAALQRDGGSPSLSDGFYMDNKNDDCNPSSLDKCQILETTAKYLGSQLDSIEPTDANLTYINSIRTLQQTLYRVRDDIDSKKKELEQLIADRQHSLQNLFNDSGFHERPYDLRAVLYTDGLNGTGHYWGYIWVELGEVNLLEDIPSQGGGWHRFCDAKVEKVTEEDVLKESGNPFALLYADRNTPTITKQEIDNITPPDLMQFVHDDNMTFENEINSESNDTNGNGDYSGNSSMTGISGDIQQSMSRLSVNTDHGSEDCNENEPARYSQDYDNCQSYSDRSNYTHQNETKKRIPNDTNDSSSTYLDNMESKQRRLSSTVMASTGIETKDFMLAGMMTKIVDGIRNCGGDDYRVMKRFDGFLARAGDPHTLANYYQRIESNLLTTSSNDNTIEDNEYGSLQSDKIEENKKRGSFVLDIMDMDSEQQIIDMDKLNITLDSLTLEDIRLTLLEDKSLFLLFELYEQYLSMGKTVTMALLLFADNNFTCALEQILKSIQQHDTWRTQLMLNDTLLWKYPGLGTLGFKDTLLKYGQACIKKLNIEAYNKACNVAYRNRGLQDGIRIANQAQLVANKSNQKKQFLSDISGRWLNFAELQSGSLSEDQAELLNTLVMIYLDGPTTTSPTSATTTSTHTQFGFTDTGKSSQHDTIDIWDDSDEPVWVAFKRSAMNAEAKLATLV